MMLVSSCVIEAYVVGRGEGGELVGVELDGLELEHDELFVEVGHFVFLHAVQVPEHQLVVVGPVVEEQVDVRGLGGGLLLRVARRFDEELLEAGVELFAFWRVEEAEVVQVPSPERLGELVGEEVRGVFEDPVGLDLEAELVSGERVDVADEDADRVLEEAFFDREHEEGDFDGDRQFFREGFFALHVSRGQVSQAFLSFEGDRHPQRDSDSAGLDQRSVLFGELEG